MKPFYVLVVSLLLSVCFLGCATTTFKPFEAKVNEFEGQGGTKEIVEGMEVWDYGTPPRKYMILGMIDDSRSGGIGSMSSLKSDVVAKAKEVGGDALIQVSNNSQFAGIYAPSGSSVAVPIRRNMSKFAVIQYLD